MRLKIVCLDRLGLVYDFSRLFFENDFNILSMEMKKAPKKADLDNVFFELEGNALDEKALFLKIMSISGVQEVEHVDYLPHEEQLSNLNAILNSVSEGIISTNAKGNIHLCSGRVENMLRLSKDEIVGRPLENVLIGAADMLDKIKKGSEARTQELYAEHAQSRYYASAFPMIDDIGHLVGSVFTLHNMKDMHRVYQRLSAQPSISFSDIVHRSDVMERLVSRAEHCAHTDSTVLLRGETGTGKELFARAIHAASDRKKEVFLAVNCASIPETLLESELFGYTEGSFTGSRKGGKPGLFELANSGTLFLDEIGEMPITLQAKLLRALQERKVRRIGGSFEVDLDIRIIAATHRPLENMIRDGKFREDLFYRLNVLPLNIPPLRERKEDIPLLAGAFFDKMAVKMKRPTFMVSDEAMDRLIDYSWPGNIRELENIVERSINVADGSIILPEHIVFDTDRQLQLMPAAAGAGEDSLTEPLKVSLERLEKSILEKALKQQKSSRKVAKLLGCSHTSVIRKMERYGLKFDK